MAIKMTADKIPSTTPTAGDIELLPESIAQENKFEKYVTKLGNINNFDLFTILDSQSEKIFESVNNLKNLVCK